MSPIGTLREYRPRPTKASDRIEADIAVVNDWGPGNGNRTGHLRFRYPLRAGNRYTALVRVAFSGSTSNASLGRDKEMIRGILLAAAIATFAGGAAFAQETCESKAVGKDGKPLAGAAKTSFMKKCMTDSCATKAVSADGKPLSGAAKNSFMTKCEKGA
jgi:hypothetical protein